LKATPVKKLDSPFGQELKHVMKMKIKDPDAKIPYIPKTSKTYLAKYKKELKRTYFYYHIIS